MTASAAGAVLLEAREISKTFPGVRALDRVSFQVRQGEVHALVGENGAGKSTLMHILAGVFPPDEGVIRLADQDVHFAGTRAAQDAGVAMVFQERSLAPPLSVAENIFFGRQPVTRWGLVDRVKLREEACRLLADLGIAVRPETPLEHLGPAEQQMVEIARAMSLDARVLVLDEPTTALTEAETAVLFRMLAGLKRRGVGIVYVSHRMAEIFQISDRITVLRDGQYQGTFPREEVSEDDLIARMVGRASQVQRAAAPTPRLDRAYALEVDGLSDGRLLVDVRFAAKQGEITALAGLAGSGRTELALAIFGARPVTAGRVLVGGRPLRVRSPRDAIRAGIGYLPENRREAGLFLAMSVAANVAVARLEQFGRWWLSDRAMEEQAAALADRLRLTAHIRGRPVEELSGGNQQKVLLSRWLLVNPPVLIVDEPTLGIDIGAKREVQQLLRELADRGTAVVLISSELPEVLTIADRILVMRAGRLVGELSPAEATEESVLRLAAIADLSR